MRRMSTTCPNILQYSAVTTGESPVTQTAEVAVKSALTGAGMTPFAVDIGNSNNSVPTKMTPTYPMRKYKGVFPFN